MEAGLRVGSFATYDVLSAAVNAIYELANVRRPPKPLHCLRHTFGTLRYVDVDEAAKREASAAVFGSGVAATWQQGPGRGDDPR